MWFAARRERVGCHNHVAIREVLVRGMLRDFMNWACARGSRLHFKYDLCVPTVEIQLLRTTPIMAVFCVGYQPV